MNPVDLGTLPITEEVLRFRQSKTLVEAMQRLISAPEFEKAITALKTITEPRRLPNPKPGNHPDTVIAEHYFLLSGASQMLGHLKSLAIPYKPGAEGIADSEEYVHALPPEYQTEPKKP